MRIGNRTNTRSILLGIALLSGCIILYFLWKGHVFDDFTPDRIELFVSRFGSLAPLAYIALLAVSIVISQIPNIPLAVAAGMLFGTFWGGIYTIIGGMLGATACFSIARSLGLTFLKKIFGKIPCFSEHCKESHLAVLIFVSRLIPFFSFDLISYCAGLTNIRMKTFLVASLFGMIPMTFLYTHLGGVIMDHTSLALILNGLVLVVFLIAPLLAKKYNLFGLNRYIVFR